MLVQLLFFNTGHFALAVFTAFVFFTTGLLFLDSWQVDKIKKTPLVRSIGFFLLALVAAIHVTAVEVPLIVLLAQLFKIIGLALILISLIHEPILRPPPKEKLSLIVPFVLPVFSLSLIPLSAILSLLICATYFRKAREGLDKQLKGAFLAFLFLGLAEVLRIPFFWSDTPIVFWSKLLAPFGTVWNTHHVFELLGIVILAVWVWGYIRFRLQVQLFVTTFALTLSIFIITTFFFAFLLLKNLEFDALSHLKTDVNVLQYALDRVQLETLSHTKAVTQDSNFKQAFIKNDSLQLYQITSEFMLSQNTSFLTVASSSGEVLMRAEDRERKGDTISDDPVVKSALSGQPLATIVSSDGITYPVVSVKAAVPIKENPATQSANIIGVVATGFVIDSAFVDGVKDVTGLDATVFGGNKRAATTFIAPDRKSRFVGTLETNKSILTQVLEKGEIYVGTANVLNQPYYTAYAPLKTFGDKPIGMLFVGKPQTALFDAAKKSIDLTFLGSIILMILSIIPAYFLSRYIKEQMEA